MKTLGKLKLTQLSQAALEKPEMNNVSGGKPGVCCMCAHDSDSQSANARGFMCMLNRVAIGLIVVISMFASCQSKEKEQSATSFKEKRER